MGPFSIRRVLIATGFAIPATAGVAGALMLFPTWLAFGCVLTGLVLFKVGSELEYQWCVVVGGVLLFGAVFSWAVRQ